MKEEILAICTCLCFAALGGLFIWQSVKLDEERARAEAAERKAEKLSIGQDFLAALVKGVKDDCAEELAVCKQEAYMDLPCYPYCTWTSLGKAP